jgi:O-antigen ligase
MNRERLDRWCERGILGLVLTLLVYGPLALGAVRFQEFVAVQTLTIGVLLLWLARVWLNPRPKLLWPPISWAVIAFVVYAVGRYLTCDIEYVGRQELLRILVYATLFFAILNNLHRQEATQIISFTLIFLAMAISLYALYQFLTHSNRVWHFPVRFAGRASGTYISPNHLAGFLEMLLPLALTYTLVGRGQAMTKIFLGYAALAIIGGIAVSGSRGSWVACIVALTTLFAVLLLNRAHRLPAGLLLLVLIGGGAWAVAQTDLFHTRLHRMKVGDRVDLDVRLVLWETAVRMWRDHLWFGVGPGHFDHRYRAYRPSSVQLQPEYAHNDYLNLLADWGIAGSLIVLLGLIALGTGIVKVWKHVRRSENEFGLNLSNKFAFVLGGTIALLALLVHATVDFNLNIPANAMLAVTLVALLSSHWRFATERYWFSARWPGRLVTTGALVAVAVYLGQQEVRLGRERVWRERAARSPELSLERAALLERAGAVEPKNFATAYQLGEIYRVEAFQGTDDYEAFTQRAIAAYQRGIANHPYDGDYYLGWGMCLDFIGRHAEAETIFLKADELDPNGYFVAAHVGRHYVETADYAAARPWLERSLRLSQTNTFAATFLKIANERLLETATNASLRSLLDQVR